MNTAALIQLWNLTQEHPGTSGARAAASVLLGLYNGSRFPCDLTELRTLDGHNLSAAITVISNDAQRCQMEVHDWLNHITGRNDFGPRFERLAHQYTEFKRGRCKVKELEQITPQSLRIIASPKARSAESLQIQDRLNAMTA